MKQGTMSVLGAGGIAKMKPGSLLRVQQGDIVDLNFIFSQLEPCQHSMAPAMSYLQALKRYRSHLKKQLV